MSFKKDSVPLQGTSLSSESTGRLECRRVSDSYFINGVASLKFT